MRINSGRIQEFVEQRTLGQRRCWKDSGAVALGLMPNAPLALAMIISDAIWTDPGTGKKTILGTFSAVIGREFPLKFPQLAVYVALTDARGRVSAHMRLVDVDEIRDPVFEKTLDLEFPDPVVTVEGTIHLHDLVFPEPGEY